MTNGQRVLTYVAASIGVLVIGWAVLIAGVFMIGGVATVSVVEHDDGMNLHLPIPMALIQAAAATTEVFFLDDILDEVEIETHGQFSQWAPVVVEILEVLEDVPNGTVLVDVHDDEEHVVVSKVRGKFRVEVESTDISVKVSVPTRSVKQTVKHLVR